MKVFFVFFVFITNYCRGCLPTPIPEPVMKMEEVCSPEACSFIQLGYYEDVISTPSINDPSNAADLDCIYHHTFSCPTQTRIIFDFNYGADAGVLNQPTEIECPGGDPKAYYTNSMGIRKSFSEITCFP